MPQTDPDFKQAEDYRIHLLVFLIAFGLRLFFLAYLSEPVVFFKYPFFAEKLAKGLDIGERIADLSPFYLYFLAFLRSLSEVVWGNVKYIHAFIGSLNAVLLFLLGKIVFNRQAGIITALLYATYGNLIALESTLEPEIFVLFFNLLTVLFLFLFKSTSSDSFKGTSFAILGGIFAGLSIITKPNFILFLPVGALWILLSSGAQATVGKKIQYASLFLLAAVLLISPVTLRNYIKLHDFILVTADAGKVFFHANSKGATAIEGTALPAEGFREEAGDEPDYAHVLYRSTASRISNKNLSPSESSKFWFRWTLNDIAQDPSEFLIREIKKFFYFFTSYEMHYIASVYKEYKKSLDFPFLRYGFISSLGILGIILSRRRFREIFLLHGILGVFLCSALVFLVQSRYRTPAVPYLCLFSGYAIYALKTQITSGKYRIAALNLVFSLILFYGINLPFYDEIRKMETWQQATKIHYALGAKPFFKAGNYVDAIAQLDACLALVPEFGPAYNLRGKAEAIIGRHEEAQHDFHKVISLHPDMMEGYKNLGYLYIVTGEKDKALEFLLQAYAIDPGNQKLERIIEDLKRQT